MKWWNVVHEKIYSSTSKPCDFWDFESDKNFVLGMNHAEAEKGEAKPYIVYYVLKEGLVGIFRCRAPEPTSPKIESPKGWSRFKWWGNRG